MTSALISIANGVFYFEEVIIGKIDHCVPDSIIVTFLESVMKVYSAVIERCPQTGLFVGFVPGFPGAHSQGETLDEVNHNLHEVIEMLLEDGAPVLESEFVGVQNVAVA